MWEILKQKMSYCFSDAKKSKRNPKTLSLAKFALPSEVMKQMQADKNVMTKKPASWQIAKRKLSLKQAPLYYGWQRKGQKVRATGTSDSNPWLTGLTMHQVYMREAQEENRAAGRRSIVQSTFANRDMDTPGTHIQRLIDTYGNREAGYKPCLLDTDGRENPRKGNFVIAGYTMNVVLKEEKGTDVLVAASQFIISVRRRKISHL